MTSFDGPDGLTNRDPETVAPAPMQSLEFQLFESLVHHLIEKGVLTKNDALSVVQTVAEVRRGALVEQARPTSADKGLALLKSLYSSFEIMPGHSLNSPPSGDGVVLELRPPRHGNRPHFSEDN